MEVKIGVQNVAREITLESTQSAKEISALVAAAVTGGKPLELTDDNGRSVVIPAGVIGYVEIGAVGERRVGFGTL